MLGFVFLLSSRVIYKTLYTQVTNFSRTILGLAHPSVDLPLRMLLVLNKLDSINYIHEHQNPYKGLQKQLSL